MKFKNIAFILLSTFTLVSCGGDPTPSPSPTPKPIHIEEELIHDGEWYSYKKTGTIVKNTTCKFTASPTSFLKYTYFGMSNYSGVEPYFSIGYQNDNYQINITSLSIKNTSGTTVLDSNKFFPYSLHGENIIIFNVGLLKADDTIIVECKFNETMTNGFWAYVGSQN